MRTNRLGAEAARAVRAGSNLVKERLGPRPAAAELRGACAEPQAERGLRWLRGAGRWCAARPGHPGTMARRRAVPTGAGGGDPVPSVPRLTVASLVDGSLLTGAVLPALSAGGAASAPRSTWVDGRDPQEPPSWSEIRARVRAAAPDAAQEARLRRIAWGQTLLFLAGVVWADVRLEGRTPGRALAGIRLVRRDGTPLTVSQAILRECAPAVRQLATDALVRLAFPDDRLVQRLGKLATAFAAPTVLLLDGERRTLGDRLAGTRLIGLRG